MIKLSRSKIELFTDCPRCFWLDVNKGIKRPPSFPYTINNAIDRLLKEQFDACRDNGTTHPIIKKYGIDARPYITNKLSDWRDNFKGVQYHYEKTDFLLFGAIDDVWEDNEGRLIVVDFKATGSNEYKIYDSYKRQMAFYQGLLRGEGYRVSETGYLLFAKVNKGGGFDDGKLAFDLYLEPCTGFSGWVVEVLPEVRKTLDGTIPPSKQECPYCQFAVSQNKIVN
jgi:CRISPR/Cas system-associated exonuclease Cas4 (RecB family)